MNFNSDKVINDARELGIKVNENSDNPGIYYIDDNGEKVKWDYESEFHRIHGKIEDMSQEDVEHLNEKLREANNKSGWSGLNIILPEDDEDETL